MATTDLAKELARRRPGRPSLGGTRCCVSIYGTDRDFVLFHRLARKRGLSVSQMVRDYVRRTAHREGLDSDLEELDGDLETAA